MKSAEREKDPSMPLRTIRRFVGNDRGATAVEYGLIVALMAAALLAGGFALGQAINGGLGEAESGLAPQE